MGRWFLFVFKPLASSNTYKDFKNLPGNYRIYGLVVRKDGSPTSEDSNLMDHLVVVVRHSNLSLSVLVVMWGIYVAGMFCLWRSNTVQLFI